MSITRFRGCFSTLGPIAAGLLAVGFIVGMLWQGGRGGNGVDLSAQEQARLGDAVAVVAGQEVYEGPLRELVSNFIQQSNASKAQQDQLPDITPTEQLGFYSNAITTGISEAVLRSLFKKEGIEVSESDVIDFIIKGEEDRIAEQRNQAGIYQKMAIQIAERGYEDAKKKDPNSQETKNRLKALEDARKSNFEDQFKQQSGGQTPEQYIATVRERAPQMLREPAARRNFELQAMLDLLRKKVAARADTSDEALKKTYDKVTYQQIAITTADAKEKAQEVLKKIRAGMTFKDAAVQFTSMKDATGKPLVNDITQTRYELQGLEGYKAILDLKEGEVSEVQMIGTSAYIFRLVGIKQELPKDFDTIKKDRIKQIQDAFVSTELKKVLDTARADAIKSIKWNDEGWRLAFEWNELTVGDKAKELEGSANKSKRIAAIKEILGRAREAVSKTPDLPVLVRYAALNQLDVETTSGPERDAIKKEMEETISAVLTLLPSTSLRLQYVHQLVSNKKADEALEQLLELARAAYPPSKRTVSLINSVEELLPKVSNLASENNKTIDEIQKELKTWHEEDKERKAAEAQAEAERKKLEEENKKEEERLKKEEEAKKKAGATPPPPAPKPGG